MRSFPKKLMKRFLNKVFIFFKWAAISFFAISIFGVILFRFINPPVTPLMIIRHLQHDEKVKNYEFRKQWVNIEQISPNMVLAVVAGEDNKFPEHWGFDWEAIQRARQINKFSKIKRGASTISQQTAKNVFLTPSRTWIRKGFEVYFTVLIEIFWSKERIMEVYLNVVELGNGVYGVEAASQKFFHKHASGLTRGEAALITSVLPCPSKRNLARPSGYMYYYQGRVLRLMNNIEKVDL